MSLMECLNIVSSLYAALWSTVDLGLSKSARKVNRALLGLAEGLSDPTDPILAVVGGMHTETNSLSLVPGLNEFRLLHVLIIPN